ncbi:Phosphatidyl inositol kinase (PIK-B), partial [Phytophthora palmivora]
MSDVVNPSDMQLSMSDGKAVQEVTSEEARRALPTELETPQNASTTEPQKDKENKWKLAFRQLMFMKRMNMHFNDRTKNEIELRQQNISSTSLICSVPYFNSFSAEEIKALVAASRRISLRPGETMSLSIPNATLQQEGTFCIVNSGHLALAKASVPSAMALKQASMYPQLRLGIGDYFCIHGSSEMKVIAMELTEYLKLPMKKILEINAASCTLIDADKNDLATEASEMESFKKWALQFSLVRQKSEYPTAEPGGYANCSVKTFCKDHFPNITPENELDHTLEYVKNALTSIFSASKVRIYALDEVNNQLVVK